MNCKVLTFPTDSEENRKYREKKDDFDRVSNKIRAACAAMGYEGDPVIDLVLAIRGMFLWTPKYAPKHAPKHAENKAEKYPRK